MEVSGELDAPAALPPGEEPTGQEAGWAPEPVWTLWRRETSLVLAGTKTPVVQPVARPYTD
jgi:hypothetical protein